MKKLGRNHPIYNYHKNVNCIEDVLKCQKLMDYLYDRFVDLSLVNDAGCWVATIGLNEKGRPRHKVGSKVFYVSNLMYVISNGELPNGLLVCHTCDNPSCINPEHLWLGTPLENMEDMKRKGRSPDQSGSNNGNARLTAGDISNVRKLLNSGCSLGSVSKVTNISKSHVYRISCGNVWNKIGLKKGSRTR